MDELTLTFVMERATKNTVRFQEEARPGAPSVIGTLYVQKQALVQMDSPNRLIVTIKPTTQDQT